MSMEHESALGRASPDPKSKLALLIGDISRTLSQINALSWANASERLAQLCQDTSYPQREGNMIAAAKNPTAPPTPTTPNASEEPEQVRLSDYTILVVEDEDDLREAICFDLTRQGFRVLNADCGAKAISLIEANKIDLILSDIQMPNGTGLELLDEVQKRPRKIPVIFVTAFSTSNERECLARGAVRVFGKPFDRKALLRTIIETLAAGKAGNLENLGS